MAQQQFDYNQFKQMYNFNFSPKLFSGLLVILLVLILFLTSWFTVSPEEVGVVLRFGEYNRQAEPGLNFKIPFGVEQVYKVAVQRQHKEEFGYRTERAGVNTVYSKSDFSNESLMLTGDLNTAEVEWIVQYRINDSYKYLFKVHNPQSTLRDMSESVMREVVGDRTVNEVLTIGRQEIGIVVEEKLQELCTQYEIGIGIDQVVLQDVNPPDPVKPSFNEVNEAQQEKEKLINQARTEYNQVIPKAKGQAQQVIQQAHGYAQERVNEARGDSAKFVSVFEEYQKAPEVTRERIYLETMNRILPKVGRKIIMDKDASNVYPLLNLGQDGLPTQGGQK